MTGEAINTGPTDAQLLAEANQGTAEFLAGGSPEARAIGPDVIALHDAVQRLVETDASLIWNKGAAASVAPIYDAENKVVGAAFRWLDKDQPKIRLYTVPEWEAFLIGVRQGEFDTDHMLILDETIRIADALDEYESLRTPEKLAVQEELMNHYHYQEDPVWRRYGSAIIADLISTEGTLVGKLVKVEPTKVIRHKIRALTLAEWEAAKDDLRVNPYALEHTDEEVAAH